MPIRGPDVTVKVGIESREENGIGGSIMADPRRLAKSLPMIPFALLHRQTPAEQGTGARSSSRPAGDAPQSGEARGTLRGADC